MTNHEHLADLHTTRRSTIVVALIGLALIHIVDLQGTWEEYTLLGVGYVVLTVAALCLAEALIRSNNMRLWLAAGVVAGAALVGFVVSRTVGLPGDHGASKGNWSEPLGLAVLLLDAIVLLLAIMHFVVEVRADRPAMG